MSITRTRFSFERDQHITEIPASWLRDYHFYGLSRRARGLLAELMTHSIEYKVSFAQLLKNGPEGKDALNTAIKELEAAGFLARRRGRTSKGTFEVEYELSEPVDNFQSATSADNPLRSGLPVPVDPLSPKTIKVKKVKQSSGLSLDEPVDNFSIDDDQVSHSVIEFPTPARLASYHPTAIDRAQLKAAIGHLFADSGITDDQLHSFGLEILGKATSHVANPTKYVIQSIRNDAIVWQQRAFQLAADIDARGGNPF